MQVFLGTLFVLGLVMLVMAVGVMFNRPALKGSCGGTGTGCPCTDAEKRSCAERRQKAA